MIQTIFYSNASHFYSAGVNSFNFIAAQCCRVAQFT
jgi:hypothetical protein